MKVHRCPLCGARVAGRTALFFHLIERHSFPPEHAWREVVQRGW